MKKISAFLIFVVFSSLVQANEISVRLRTDQTIQGCTFDRTVSTPHLMTDHLRMGAFAVHCKDPDIAYRINTSLSPFAKVSLEGGASYKVRFWISENAIPCDTKITKDVATRLHSASRSVALTSEGIRSVWSYCIQLVPEQQDVLSDYFNWPLQGELSLTLSSALKGWELPEGAYRTTVYFDNNVYDLTVGSKQSIDTLMASVSGDISDYHVQLHAHTSLIGDHAYNHGLSIMRLKNVRDYLVQDYNILKSDTWGQAWGETRPHALHLEEGLEATLNRRVDFILLPKKEASLPSVEVFSGEKIPDF